MRTFEGDSRWDDEDFDAVIGGALGWWKLGEAAAVVRRLLHEVFSWRNESIADIAEPTANGEFAEYARCDEEYVLALKEMACSQVTVGAIAPLIETLIDSAIRKRRENHQQIPYKGNDRVCQLEALLKPIEGSCDMPNLSWASALFDYRNTALHNGYDWELGKRKEFARKITEKGWDNWFDICTSDDTPLFISLTDGFIDNALKQMEVVALALRKAQKKLDLKR